MFRHHKTHLQVLPGCLRQQEDLQVQDWNFARHSRTTGKDSAAGEGIGS
jgi:hypothetical protein